MACKNQQIQMEGGKRNESICCLMVSKSKILPSYGTCGLTNLKSNRNNIELPSAQQLISHWKLSQVQL
jgi:hypothetical protein